MGSAIVDTLPFAIGIAISPVPVIAVILMLLSPQARVTSVGFLLGWMVGIVGVTTLSTVLASLLPTPSDDRADPVRAIIHIVLAAGLLLLAARVWQRRPKPGEEPPMPAWMAKIDEMSFGGAFGLGALLSGVNPKNLILAAGAGLSIGAAGLAAGAIAPTILVFTVIAASSILVPVVGYLIASERLSGALDALRAWLVRYNSTIMAILLLVLWFVMIARAIGSF
ncbi:GAP family protein [Microbacterium hominis]|uniref:GAP family protein n=1 Tax=Microbacterium hominis TaxID=162426 RepID=A0A7D4PKQ9_9MICO|nr:GAP family protein [Microbacterium hominis]QKJ18315.1 GAP family protein [Microbacterium hominis]